MPAIPLVGDDEEAQIQSSSDPIPNSLTVSQTANEAIADLQSHWQYPAANTAREHPAHTYTPATSAVAEIARLRTANELACERCDELITEMLSLLSANETIANVPHVADVKVYTADLRARRLVM
jgi:hypothetical protein